MPLRRRLKKRVTSNLSLAGRVAKKSIGKAVRAHPVARTVKGVRKAIKRRKSPKRIPAAARRGPVRPRRRIRRRPRTIGPV